MIEASERGTAISLGLLTFAATAYFFHQQNGIPNPNETARVYLAMSIVDERTLSIDTPFRKYGPVWDRSVVNGKSYSDKAPGVAFLAVPFYLAAKGIASVFGAELSLRAVHFITRLPFLALNALFVATLFLFLRPYAPEARIRAAVVLAYAFGTIAFTYAPLLFSHQHAAVLVFGGFALIESARRAGTMMSVTRALIAGFALGMSFAVEYPVLFLLVVIGAYALLTVRPWTRIALVVAGAAIPVGLTLYYNATAFGSPFKTGYSHLASSFAAIHAKGLFGVTTPTWDAFAGNFFSLNRGLFVLSPFLAFAIPGFWSLARKAGARAVFWTCLAATAAYVYFVSSFGYWVGGDSTGPRHFTPVIPFLLVPVACFANALSSMRFRFPSVWFLAAAISSVVLVQFASIPYPYFEPRIANPYRDFALDFWRDGLVPTNPGMWFGLEGMASAIPFAALIAIVLRRIGDVSEFRMVRFGAALIAALGFLYVLAAKPQATDQLSRVESARYRADYTPRPKSEGAPGGPVAQIKSGNAAAAGGLVNEALAAYRKVP
ncbi:MAG: hypothetical protein HYY84_10515 [Deltaproteobacteria bacterium]|nr:hypothetical protein [Deltaproteobacteria bacterium]